MCSHPDTDDAWWAPVSDLFQDPQLRAKRRIEFDKRRDRFDKAAAPRLLNLGISPSGPLYVQSLQRPESLLTNLLRVTWLPDVIWAAPAIVVDNVTAKAVLRQRGYYSSDWMVLERTVYSFRRPDDEPLVR